ncbi:MAG: SRPBCC family protein [Rhodobacteraceae bacterium]|nr:SRPBCC family protein [Paracoccaceae bacterium]
MTGTGITHDSFTIERRLAACPAHVWAAWSDPDLKRRWFVDSDGPDWQTAEYSVDFRVGGGETGRFVLSSGPGAGEHANVTHYLDIVPRTRIVFAYTMALDGRIHSASLATVRLEESGGGTILTFTEQGAYFAPSDGATGRRAGWEALLTALERILKTTTRSAAE